mmetsp:Transcript_76583/g.123881  ORF Transcript_76583/g.123881 Transcript_76583/m.123881 type:complete len:107 (+) Transcript_76583:250-570(+)
MRLPAVCYTNPLVELKVKIMEEHRCGTTQNLMAELQIASSSACMTHRRHIIKTWKPIQSKAPHFSPSGMVVPLLMLVVPLLILADSIDTPLVVSGLKSMLLLSLEV